MEQDSTYLASQLIASSGETFVFNCANGVSVLYPDGSPSLSEATPLPRGATPHPYLHVGLDDTGSSHGVGRGEFTWIGPTQAQRLATFMPIPLLGYGQREYQPWQVTYAYLASMFDWDDLLTAYGKTDLLQFLSSRPQPLSQLHTEAVKAPRSSSCIYLCDAVAAAIGLCRHRAFRGQGERQLRSLLTPQALRNASDSRYSFNIRLLYHQEQPLPYLDPRSLWQQLLEDLQQGEAPSSIAGRFYLGLIQGIADMIGFLGETHAARSISVSGQLLQHDMLT
ncbi:MAG: hypothetical protein WBA10_03685, partial [Elainellaceae cyanobacterium]